MTIKNFTQSGLAPTPTLASFCFGRTSATCGKRGDLVPPPSFLCKKKLVSGFTLLETMVAIAILLIAVVGPISLIGNSLHQIYYARDEMSAVNLAQEGVEAVRRVRDTNMLARPTGGWAKDFSSLSKKYLVDSGNIYISSNGKGSSNGFLISCPGSGCSVTSQRMYLDSGTGLYRQTNSSLPSGWTSTQFSRVVDINLVSSDEYAVISTVTWTTGGQAGTVSVSENIFNWAP
jgi:prepilin-type N-terminal cleavage/methylation domain-containing protein